MNREDNTIRLNFPFSLGLYLGVNAVPDAYLLVDGPSCAFHKAEIVHGNHDLNSTLLDAGGDHRISNTDLDVLNIVSNRMPVVTRRLDSLKRLPGAGVVLLSSLPMATLVPADYDLALESLKGTRGGPLVRLPDNAFDGDWIDGYACILQALAETVDLDGGRPRRENVAVVGYLMDRTEADHEGNVRELKDLLKGLALNPVSIWLENAPFCGGLSRVKDAGTIISLPHGREAARTLARRLNAHLIETDLPFGLSATQRWLEHIAEVLGREEEAARVIEDRLRRVVPRLEWIVSNILQHLRVAFIGDPFFNEGLRTMACDFGFDVCCSLLTAKSVHAGRFASGPAGRTEGIFEPPSGAACDRLQEAHESDPVDLVISNVHHLSIPKALGIPFLEFGFPNFITHRLYEAPFLGFMGCLKILEEITNRLRLFETLSFEPIIDRRRPLRTP